MLSPCLGKVRVHLSVSTLKGAADTQRIRLLAFDAMAQRHERGEFDPKAH
jgi:hypothetical protein